MYLLFLTKYLTCVLIWMSFTYNGDGKALLLCLYSIKYLHESLPHGFSWEKTVSSISTSLMLMGLLFLWKAL